MRDFLNKIKMSVNLHTHTYRCDPDKNYACSKYSCYRNRWGTTCLVRCSCRRTIIRGFKMDTFKRIKEKLKEKFIYKI